MPDPTDDIFWYNLHMETLDNFERERITWRKTIERLKRDIAGLREELHDTRVRVLNANGLNGSGHHGGMNGSYEDGDKVFTDQAIIEQARAKLRELSVVSPGKEPGNPFDKPSPSNVDGVKLKRSAISRQPSQEASSRSHSQGPRVTISDSAVETIGESSAETSMSMSLQVFRLSC